MNKKILISLSVIGVIAAIAIGGTIAYFQDVETSTGNTFSAGTFDLKIRGSGTSYQDNMGPIWTISDIKPGDSVVSREFNFKNTGSIVGDHMEITCDYSVDETANPVESDTDPSTDDHPKKMAKNFTITTLMIRKDGGNDTNLLSSLTDWNINGRKDLQDLKEAGINNVTPVPQPNEASYTTVSMGVELNELAGNDFQGDTFDLTMIFTLNQDASQ